MTTSADTARLFAALGDPVRLELIEALAGGPRSIADLSRGRKISRQGVTKHLHVLEGAGLIVAERAGREVRWRGQGQALAPAAEYLARVGARWESALERLKRQAEEG